ncbi:MAG: BrnT family toxin [Acidobacteriota bacterium]
MRFEWDHGKDRVNVEKHGIDFATAALVFADPQLLLREDRMDGSGEQRWHALGLVAGLEPLLVVVHDIGRLTMAKKSSASSRPEKLVRRKAEDIFGEPPTKRQLAVLDRLAKKQDSQIDYSDIPPLSDEQLAQMVPFRLRSKTTLISFRVQNDVLTWLRSKGPGHLSRINAILANVMDAEQRLKTPPRP